MWHGMLDLANVTELGGPVRLPATTVPVGKLVLRLSSTERNLSARGFLNATSIAGDLATLALPSPGAVFSFEQKLERRNTVTITGGLFSGPRTSDLKSDRRNKCVVGEEVDAAVLSAQLRGRYLPVTCEGGDEAQNTKHTRKWAYLLDSK